LVGESGCGKTTLSRALLRLAPLDAGSVEFDGQNIGRLGRAKLREIRARMQIVFQDPASALDPRLSIRDSLEEGLANLGLSRDERDRRVRESLDRVGIAAARAGDYPHRFSGGQKQRVVIARALAMRPDFLVLDEPVSSLDVSVQAQIVNLLRELKGDLGLTYLFVSHDLDLVAYMSDRVAVMKDGRIVETGLTSEIIDASEHPYTRELFATRSPLGGKADSLVLP